MGWHFDEIRKKLRKFAPFVDVNLSALPKTFPYENKAIVGAGSGSSPKAGNNHGEVWSIVARFMPNSKA
jgi:hypothetical protein